MSAENDSGGDVEHTAPGPGPSPASGAQPGDKTEAGDAEVPRRRRGILLGMRPGEELAAAPDDEKSLTWMASQAVKALNAVKASQMEQAQALKAREEGTEDEAVYDEEDQGASRATAEALPPTPEQQLEAMRVLNAEEISADAASVAVQSGMAAIAPLPASTPPVQTANVGEPGGTPPLPSVEPASHATAAVSATSRIPVKPILILGVLLMFGYASYHYWFSGERMAEEESSSPSTVVEPSEPELGREMAAPAISVVPASHEGGHETESGAQVPPFAGSSTAAPQSSEPEGESPASQAAAPSPQSPTVHPEPAPVPQTWQPTAAPAAESAGASGRAVTPSSAVPAVVEPPTAPLSSAKPASTVSPPSQPPVVHPQPQVWQPTAAPVAESATVSSQPPAMAPPARTESTVKPVAPKPPAVQPAHPAGGYGYYPPPQSWQPYYRPGYPQPPARR